VILVPESSGKTCFRRHRTNSWDKRRWQHFLGLIHKMFGHWPFQCKLNMLYIWTGSGVGDWSKFMGQMSKKNRCFQIILLKKQASSHWFRIVSVFLLPFGRLQSN